MRQPKLSSLDRWHCLAAWGDRAKVPEEAGLAQIPRSPSRLKRSAPAKGWPQGASSAPSAGLSIQAFAAGLDHPRWLYVLPTVTFSSPKPMLRRGRGVPPFMAKCSRAVILRYRNLIHRLSF